MQTIKYNNVEYSFEDAAYDWYNDKQTTAKVQLFGVVIDKLGPAIIGVIHSQYGGTPCWLPMRWDLKTGKHYDEGFSLVPVNNS